MTELVNTLLDFPGYLDKRLACQSGLEVDGAHSLSDSLIRNLWLHPPSKILSSRLLVLDQIASFFIVPLTL